MDAAPPTYEHAVVRDYWSLVAPHLGLQDLLNATLVCQAWNKIFSRALWGSPLRHFKAEDFVHQGQRLYLMLQVSEVDGLRRSPLALRQDIAEYTA